MIKKVIELEKQKFEIRKMDAVSGERWFWKALSLIGHVLNLMLLSCPRLVLTPCLSFMQCSV